MSRLTRRVTTECLPPEEPNGSSDSVGNDPHDDIEWALDFGFFYLLYREAVRWDALVVLVQSRRFHSVASYFWMPYGVLGGAAYSTAAPLERKFKLRDGSGRSLPEGARQGRGSG